MSILFLKQIEICGIHIRILEDWGLVLSRGDLVYFVENALFILTTLETLSHFRYNNHFSKKITITTANSLTLGGSKVLYILIILTASLLNYARSSVTTTRWGVILKWLKLNFIYTKSKAKSFVSNLSYDVKSKRNTKSLTQRVSFKKSERK